MRKLFCCGNKIYSNAPLLLLFYKFQISCVRMISSLLVRFISQENNILKFSTTSIEILLTIQWPKVTYHLQIVYKGVARSPHFKVALVWCWDYSLPSFGTIIFSSKDSKVNDWSRRVCKQQQHKEWGLPLAIILDRLFYASLSFTVYDYCGIPAPSQCTGW